ncbi:phage head-tail connector protein [Halalkalibacter krulwichiae]|uniref:Phage gp6-like head-tail connector protein n=1 Tax=Halalkalibacter krulwichiae TaxID=199441 RepID=A0A1X9MF97_9BACI|nr:phage head-tail connector protein [Halalkalibacter krulwichiae]ARK30773.1 Phage gp6-like head-tail connector protein [Halalkalibacter krulwichiae]
MPSIANIKALLDLKDNDNSEDNVLLIYLTRATNHVLTYCNVKELNSSLEELAEDIAVFNYRNKGVENIVSEGKGSLSESYRDDLPPDIIRRLNENRRMRFV